jgi:hypothetical protein
MSKSSGWRDVSDFQLLIADLNSLERAHFRKLTAIAK